VVQESLHGRKLQVGQIHTNHAVLFRVGQLRAKIITAGHQQRLEKNSLLKTVEFFLYVSKLDKIFVFVGKLSHRHE